MIIARKGDPPHFTKDFGGGASSDRLILPEIGGSPTRVTRFQAPPGTFFETVSNPCPETVYVIKGRIQIEVIGQNPEIFEAGDVFVILPNEKHSFLAMTDAILLCVYSQNPETGAMPYEDVPSPG
jgi:quercetin dioxygenase-like cupin family protein